MNPSTSNPDLAVPAWVLVLGFIIFGPLIAMGPRLAPGAIVFATLAFIPFLCAQREHVKAFFFRREMAFIAVVVGYSCLTALWSPSHRALDMAIDMAYLSICAALLCCATFLLPRKIAEGYLFYLTLSLVAGYLVVAEEFLFNHPIHRWFNELPPNADMSENVTKRMMALFSLTLWPVAAWLEKTRGRAWGVVAVIGFLAFCLVATSRSASLGMIIGTIVMALAFFIPALLRWALIGFVVIGLVLVVPAGMAVPKLPSSAVDFLFSSAQVRLKIWQYTANHVPEAPLFGHGIDASRDLKTTVGKDGGEYLKPGTYSISSHPHNLFLQLWLDFGALGAALWGFLIIRLLHSLRLLSSDLQPYALGAATCSLIMLSTTFTPLQAWWAAGHIATALLFLLLAHSFSNHQLPNKPEA